MHRRALALITLALVLGGPAAALAASYEIDRDHTSVTFTIRHLFSKVHGRFGSFDGAIEFDPAAPDAAKVEGSIDVASIDTNVAERDKHLRSEDFFDVAKFPRITFASTRVTGVDAAKKTGKLEGTLTIHGVSRPVTLDVAFLGAGKDPWGNQIAAFSASTKINRKDFGLAWNETLETGGVLVGEEVEIEIQAEAKPKK